MAHARKALRQTAGGTLLMAILACGGGGDRSSGASDATYACDERPEGGCTQYTSASRVEGFGIDFLRESCQGRWREGTCPTEDLVAACHEPRSDTTRFHYVSMAPETFVSLEHARRWCAASNGSITVTGSPTRSPELTYPELSVDTDWHDAELDASDMHRVVTADGAYESPYDVYRVELTAGERYTLMVRRPGGGESPDARDVRDVDPNGLDIQALHVFGPHLEIAERDQVTGDETSFIQVVATRTGPHAVMVESGRVRDGQVVRVALGPYQVRVVRGAARP